MKSVSFGGRFGVLCSTPGLSVTYCHRSWMLCVGSSCRSPWLASPTVEASSHRLGQGLFTGAPVFLGALCPKIEPLTGQKKEVVLGQGNSCWNLSSTTGFWKAGWDLVRFCTCLNESPPIGNWSGKRTLCVWLHQRGIAFLSPRAERG